MGVYDTERINPLLWTLYIDLFSDSNVWLSRECFQKFRNLRFFRGNLQTHAPEGIEIFKAS